MGAPPKTTRSRAATLADVGRTAGVSAMAASAVLNGARTSSRISPDTRARILAVAQQLQYRPNAAARGLASGRMNTIGIAVVVDPSDLNIYFMELLNGVLEAAARHEQNTMLFTLHDWADDARARLPKFCDGRVDGMILVAPLLPAKVLQQWPEHTPFVTIHSNSSVPGVVNLESDEETGAYQLVSHLIAQGHRQILHFTGNRGMRGAERRINGYERAFSTAGIPCDPMWIVDSGFGTIAGRNSMRDWLRQRAGAGLPHAIFAANDSSAVGIMEVLAEAGYSVPDDVSVAGFDDSLAARTTSPQLTTIRQPLRAMGWQGVESLLAEIGHGHSLTSMAERAPIVFPTELVVRASVAPRRTD